MLSLMLSVSHIRSRVAVVVPFAAFELFFVLARAPKFGMGSMMAGHAQSYEISRRVRSQLASIDKMMDLQIDRRAARLALPPVAFQDLNLQLGALLAG
jgi:hypothetical protein